MTKKFTFRTEGFQTDNECAPLLAELSGLKVVNVIEQPDGPLVLNILHCTSDKDLETIRTDMERIAEEDGRFVDMHRCYQTLAEGDETNERWWDSGHNNVDLFKRPLHTQLSVEGSKRLREILDNPPEPTTSLIELMTGRSVIKRSMLLAQLELTKNCKPSLTPEDRINLQEHIDVLAKLNESHIDAVVQVKVNDLDTKLLILGPTVEIQAGDFVIQYRKLTSASTWSNELEKREHHRRKAYMDLIINGELQLANVVGDEMVGRTSEDFEVEKVFLRKI